MKVIEEKNSLWHQLVVNMEEGFQKLNEFHYELGKTSLQFVKKQNDLLLSVQENVLQLEDGWQKSMEAWLESMKLRMEEGSFPEFDFHIENWNKQFALLTEQVELLSIQQNPLPVHLLEELQQKLYEISQVIIDEQKRRHEETVAFAEKNLQQFLEYYTNFMKKVEEEMNKKQ